MKNVVRLACVYGFVMATVACTKGCDGAFPHNGNGRVDGADQTGDTLTGQVPADPKPGDVTVVTSPPPTISGEFFENAEDLEALRRAAQNEELRPEFTESPKVVRLDGNNFYCRFLAQVYKGRQSTVVNWEKFFNGEWVDFYEGETLFLKNPREIKEIRCTVSVRDENGFEVTETSSP